MAQFNAADAAISAQIAIHQREVDRLNAESAADPSKRLINAQAVRDQEAAIISLVQNGVPKLREYVDALSAKGVDEHKIDELRAKLEGMSVTAAKLQKDLGKGGFWGDTGAQIKQLGSQWGDLSHNVGNVAVSAFHHFGQASTEAIMGLINGTETAGQAFAKMAQSIIAEILQMVIQYMIFKTIMKPMMDGFMGFSGGGAVTPTPMAGEMAEGGFVRGFPTGGFVSGPGGPKDDLIPAMLSNGEYVLPAHVVDQLGVDRLDALRLGLSNRTIPMPRTGTVPAFAGGGVVGAIGNLKLPAPQVTTGPALFVFGKEEYARFAATTEGREMLREAARRNAAETGRALAARERGQQ